MHPLIRVLSLAALASGLPLLALPDLLILCLLLWMAHLRLAPHAVLRLRAGIWRLRWLFLAIFVLYWGFTPGTALLPALPGLSLEGVLEGLRRAAVLLSLLMAVYLLLARTSVPELVQVLRSLVTPLRVLGLDRDRFALRMALALEGVTAAQNVLDAQRSHSSGFAASAAATVQSLELAAEAPTPALRVSPLPAVPLWQWLLPIALLMLLHGVLS